jgi:hypothetical protein
LCGLINRLHVVMNTIETVIYKLQLELTINMSPMLKMGPEPNTISVLTRVIYEFCKKLRC